MPVSSKSPPQPPLPTASEIMQAEVARIKRLLGLDINRLAIGSDIEGEMSGGLWPTDYTINGVNVIEFVNVASDIVYGTQTGAATDTVAPNQTTGLVATPASNTIINLNWNASSAIDLSLYNVYRGTSSGFTIILGTTTPTATPSTNSYSDTGRTASTAYYYKVSAVDTSTNIGALSTEANATTFPTPPAQTVGLTVTPHGGSDTQLDLAWTASTAPAFSYYNVYRGPTGFTPGPSFLIAQPTTNSYANTSLIPGTAYYYKVSAVDTSLQEGTASSQVSGTTTGTAPIPPGLWLPFDGNYNDSSSFGNTVNPSNSSGFVGSGVFGGDSVKLNSPTAGLDYVAVPNSTNTALDLVNGFSYSCWIYPTSTTANQYILSKWIDASNYIGIAYIGTTAYITVDVWEGGVRRGVKTPTGISLNTWHHVVLTDSGTTTKIYLDKVLSTTANSANFMAATPTDLIIGNLSGDSTGNLVFRGRIDEVQYFKGVVLTQTQVNNLFATNAT